ncbi:MAG: hypothetical protein HOP28_09530 [Gemmatimonadales bacterium]|nr:hypothetical protein [Gemmatimonadales bacterium]
MAVLALAAAAGCKKSSTGPEPQPDVYSIVQNGTVAATATIGTDVAISFLVRRTPSGGTAVAANGQTVTLTVTAGGGSVAGSNSTAVTTGTDGTAGTAWRLGSVVGAQTIRASIAGGAHVDVTMTGTAPPATQLTLTTVPSSTPVSGTPFPQQPVVQLKDATGANAAQAGVVVTASIESGGGTLGGTVTATTNASGAAAFTDLSVVGPNGNRVLRFAATPATAMLTVSSGLLALTQPVVTQLAVMTQPSAALVSGSALAQQPVVQLRAGTALNVFTAGVAVTASIESGGGTLGGTVTVATDANGTATFTNLTITGAAGARVLRFAATPAAAALFVLSGSIQVTLPPQLAITTAPPAAPNHQIPFFSQPVIQLLDGNGAAASLAGVPVTVTIASGAGALGVPAASPGAGIPISHVAALTVNTNASGQAAFTDLLIAGSGNHTLKFSAPGYADVTTAPLAVNGSPVILAPANATQVVVPSSAAGVQTYFQFTSPVGTNDFRASLFGGSGTRHLYMRRGAYPTATAFDCRSSADSPVQVCNISANQEGQWFGAIDAVTAQQQGILIPLAYGPACAAQALTVNQLVNGQLNTALDCRVPAGTTRDRYQFTLATPQAIAVTHTTNNFIYISVKEPVFTRLFFTITSTSGTSTAVLTGAGTYDLEVVDNTAAQGAGQVYSIAVVPASPNLAICAGIFGQNGANAQLMLAGSDCAGTTAGTRSDRIFSGLGAGQTMTVTMSSTAFDPVLKLFTGQVLGAVGTPLATDDNGGGGTSARLVYTNTGNLTDITIEAGTTGAGGTGLYTLTIAVSQAALNAPPAFAPSTFWSRIETSGAGTFRPRVSAGGKSPLLK